MPEAFHRLKLSRSELDLTFVGVQDHLDTVSLTSFLQWLLIIQRVADLQDIVHSTRRETCTYEITMSQPSSSYADISRPDDDLETVDSLPSSSAGSSTSVSPSEEEAMSDAEREWRESLQQLELLLTMVLVPYVGKYFGRKCAYWGM